MNRRNRNQKKNRTRRKTQKEIKYNRKIKRKSYRTRKKRSKRRNKMRGGMKKAAGALVTAAAAMTGSAMDPASTHVGAWQPLHDQMSLQAYGAPGGGAPYASMAVGGLGPSPEAPYAPMAGGPLVGLGLDYFDRPYGASAMGAYKADMLGKFPSAPPPGEAGVGGPSDFDQTDTWSKSLGKEEDEEDEEEEKEEDAVSVRHKTDDDSTGKEGAPRKSKRAGRKAKAKRKRTAAKSLSVINADLSKYAINQPWERPISCTFGDGGGEVRDAKKAQERRMIVEINPGNKALLGEVMKDLEDVRNGNDQSEVIDGSRYNPPFSEGLYYNYVINSDGKLHYVKMTGYGSVKICSNEYKDMVDNGLSPFREGDGTMRTHISEKCYLRQEGQNICHGCLVDWVNAMGEERGGKIKGYMAGTFGVIVDRDPDGKITQMSVIGDHRSGHFTIDGKQVIMTSLHGEWSPNAGTKKQARVSVDLFHRYLADSDPPPEFEIRTSAVSHPGVRHDFNGLADSGRNWEETFGLV